MRIRPSRFLNEKSGFLGLSIVDLGVLSYVLVLIHPVFASFGLDLLAFIVTAALGFFLMGIRLRHRPKTIRDYFISIPIRWGLK